MEKIIISIQRISKRIEMIFEKLLITAIILLTALILLFPFKLCLKDGGTIKYVAVLYTVSKEHSLAFENGEDGHMIGTQVRILFWWVYNDVKFVPNPI